MINFINNIFEDFLLSRFIAKNLNIKKYKTFIIISTIMTAIETTYFDYSEYSSLLIPTITLTHSILIYIFKKEFCSNDLTISVLGSCLVVTSSIFAVLTSSLILSIPANEVASKIYSLYLTMIISKIYICILSNILYTLNKKFINNPQHSWGILSILWIIIFVLLYILGESIVFNQVSIFTIYLVTVSVLILFIVAVLLFLKISSVNDTIINLEIINQRNQLDLENRKVIRMMYDDVIRVKHDIFYILVNLKHLTLKKNYDELLLSLNKNINKIKRYRNYVYTGNGYFDFLFSEILNSYGLNNDNIKHIISINSTPLLDKKEYVELLVDIFKYLFEMSDKDNLFDIHIHNSHNNFYFNITFTCTNENIDFPDDLKNRINKCKMFYSIKKDNSFILFKSFTIY